MHSGPEASAAYALNRSTARMRTPVLASPFAERFSMRTSHYRCAQPVLCVRRRGWENRCPFTGAG